MYSYMILQINRVFWLMGYIYLFQPRKLYFLIDLLELIMMVTRLSQSGDLWLVWGILLLDMTILNFVGPKLKVFNVWCYFMTNIKKKQNLGTVWTDNSICENCLELQYETYNWKSWSAEFWNNVMENY